MTKLRKSMDFVNLDLPEDSDLLDAAGRVALRHGQLELILRMTIKTLAGVTVDEALSATETIRNNTDLRKEVKSLFYHRTNDPTLRLKLRAILGECERLSKKRNRLLHNTWAIAPDGSIVMKGEKHAWGPAPTSTDLRNLESEIGAVVATLNRERLEGFIRQVSEGSDGASA